MAAYPIDKKLVIAVSSTALFDLKHEDNIYREKGVEEYRKHQRDNQDEILQKGVAFPFIKRFLNLNSIFSEEQPVEVVLLSRNDPDTGMRVLNSIKHHGLDISRSGFLKGNSPFPYIPAFNISLFLSSSEADVRSAIDHNYPAGQVLDSKIEDDNGVELRVAFDYDAVIADDESETIYANEDLTAFQKHEQENVAEPHNPGPLHDLFQKLAFFQKMETKRQRKDKSYRRILRIAIITARNSPGHKRMITSLRKWDISPDETFFLGGIDKKRILEVMKPHIYFDDQKINLNSMEIGIPSVHIPFGIRNKKAKEIQ